MVIQVIFPVVSLALVVLSSSLLFGNEFQFF